MISFMLQLMAKDIDLTEDNSTMLKTKNAELNNGVNPLKELIFSSLILLPKPLFNSLMISMRKKIMNLGVFKTSC